MANRLWEEKINQLEKGVVLLSGKIVVGAAGAVTSSSIKGASVARSSAGVYTITLEDAYVSLLACQASLLAALTTALKVCVQSADVSSAKTIVLRVDNAIPAAADPASGNEIHVVIVLKNSTV